VYRLFSIPLEMQGSILAAIADDLGGVDNTLWRLFGYDAVDQTYVELPRNRERAFTQGRAYWLIAREGHRVDIADDDGLTAATNEPFVILLEPGYNLVSNPFAFEVDWSKFTVQDSLTATDSLAATIVEPPVRWIPGSGYRYDTKTLAPFDGYWINNLTDGPVRLGIPPWDARVAPPGVARSSDGDGAWTLTVRASMDDAAVVPAVAELGARAGADGAWDRYDRTMPPPAPQRGLGVCFPHGEWDTRPGRYARDVRPESALQGTVARFDVAKNFSVESGGDAVTLAIEGIDALPATVAAELVDGTLSRRIDLRARAEYTCLLAVKEPGRRADDARFALIVGDADFVSAQASALVNLPGRTVLHQNHPNPFNPATVIRYDLAEPARVTVRVYDVRGALVRVLEDRTRGIGRYEVGWDGTDERGTRVASGVYFYRLTAGRFSATRKMVVLK
jgi:hypothetical protein